ncbi:MAG TPA: hypothetical protein VK206_16625, partial [Anaerolineales bacterium]|nr:hypothetical protein [Anaerolineales bacterium]
DASTSPAQREGASPLSASKPSSKPIADPAVQATQPPRENTPLQSKTTVKSSAQPPVRQAAERNNPSYIVDSGFDDMPPPPDNFPEDWDTQWQPSFEEASIAARPEPKANNKPIDEPPLQQTASVATEIKDNKREQAEAARDGIIVQQIGSIPTESTDFLPSLYIPLAQDEKDQEHPPQQITVVLRSTGDRERDRRRIKTIFGTLISFHGRDRFSFQIFEDGKGHLIDFPNDTTRVCTEVLDRLKKLMGEESWRVEEITFQ